jgi:hypothetical protein
MQLLGGVTPLLLMAMLLTARACQLLKKAFYPINQQF